VQHQQSIVVVVAAGAPHPTIRDRLPAGAVVIAADGGVDTALALGLHVSVAIGDFDSISDDGLAAAEAAGAQIERHPAAKDATDLELALDRALELDPQRIVVVGADNGRIDHLLEGLLLLGSPQYERVELDALLGPATASVVRDRRTLDAAAGELISLLPLHGPAEGVVTEGLVYPLRGETLHPGSSRGISNVFAVPSATVTLTGGVVVALRPGQEERRAR
jgi:thiamine pyrophosphokinase